MSTKSHTDLHIAIVDANKVESQILKTVFENIDDVESVFVFEDPNEALRSFPKTDSLLVDIFTIGIEKGLELIENVRTKYPYAPICLLGGEESLLTLPNIPENWKVRFSHFYKLAKDQTPTKLRVDSEHIAYNLSAYLLAEKARIGLGDLRKIISGGPSELTPENSIKAETITSQLEQVLEFIKKHKLLEPSNIVPGFCQEDIQKLVQETLSKASTIIGTTSKVNKTVLWFGISLVFISLIASIITGKLDTAIFGGLGMAGIIATLITNPLRNISIGANRIVQIQVIYLGFLTQLDLFKTLKDNKETNFLEISKQLGEAMKNSIAMLEKLI